MEIICGKFLNEVFLTTDLLNAFSIPVRPSCRQYWVNATSSTDIREMRDDISKTYALSISTARKQEYGQQGWKKYFTFWDNKGTWKFFCK